MRKLSLYAAVLAVAACGHNAVVGPPAPPPPPPPVVLEDPPAMVHAINQTADPFNAWLLIVGADADHSSIVPQARVFPGASGERCLFTSSLPGERRFIYAAVTPVSALDNRLKALSTIDAAAVAFRDSLSKGQINTATFFAANPGLVAATPIFDPAVPGYGPADTVAFRWTVAAPNSNTIAVDTADHTCTRKL
jgi:hypothetical protein